MIKLTILLMDRTVIMNPLIMTMMMILTMRIQSRSPFEEDDEEEQEHLALSDSSDVPIVDHVLAAGEAAGIRMRALLPSTSRRTDIPEADMMPQKRACLTTPAPGFKIGEISAAGAARWLGPTESDLRRCRVEQAGYRITNT
nr:hypothetical protein [Tanacetum cinerariifolium]